MSPWLASAAYPRHSPFSTLLHSLCARARNIISSLAENGQTQRKYHCPRDTQHSEGFQTISGDHVRRVVDAFAGGPDIATPGSHCPMATALLNSDVNGGTVARVSARARSWRQR